MTPFRRYVSRTSLVVIGLSFLQVGCLQLLIPKTNCDRTWPTSGKVVFYGTGDLTGVNNGTATGSTNVWVMNGDGTGRTPLTTNTIAGLDLNPPRISGDASRVTYFGFADITGVTDGTATVGQNIWTVKADGTSRTAITQNTAGVDSQFPDLNYDGSRVAFQSNQSLVSTLWDQPPNNCLNVFVANATGGGLTPLTQNTVAGLNSFVPNFSPDGSKIVMHSLTALSGAWDGASSVSRNIWIMNSDGTGRVALTQNQGAGYNSRIPLFSPGGGWITFYSNTDITGVWNGAGTASTNVWVVRPDGSGLTAITRNTAAGLDSAPAQVSYDDKKVVFYSSMSLSGVWNAAGVASFNVWIANIDGSGLTPLTLNTAAGLSSQPAGMSHDGKKIYFYSTTALNGSWNGTPENSYNLWVMDVDGSNRQALTANTAASLDLYSTHLAQPSLCR